MIAILDVQYDGDGPNEGNTATGGMVLIKDWSDATPFLKFNNRVKNCAPYQPGEFYKRELPVLLELLSQTTELLDVIVIDAHVDLDDNLPGLGRYLYEALNEKVDVIGAAKSQFRESEIATELLRCGSIRPLFVTSAGIDQAKAVAQIKSMHGKHRMPDMLKMADGIARGNVSV